MYSVISVVVCGLYDVCSVVFVTIDLLLNGTVYLYLHHAINRHVELSLQRPILTNLSTQHSSTSKTPNIQ